MIKFQNLKENLLLSVNFPYKFSIMNVDFEDGDFIDINQYDEASSTNFLILLKKFDSNTIDDPGGSPWYCFCNGKICVFNILNSDLEILSIVT
jgi:hypothetical protein